MRILITGASGFIGSHLMERCLADGHSILAHRRTSQNSPRTCNIGPDSRWLCCDLLEITPEHLEGVEGIFHLAATGVSPRSANWSELLDINVRGTHHVCNLSKQLGVRLVISGTFAEYGLSGLRYERIPPHAPLEPTYPYAVSKAAAFQLAAGFARSESLELAYMRIFNAFGEGQHISNLWPSLKKAAYAGEDFLITPGQQVRDFVCIELVTRCLLNALIGCSIPKGEPLIRNIGSGVPVTVADFCRHWWRQFNAKGELKIGALDYRTKEVMRFVPEIEHELVYGLH